MITVTPVTADQYREEFKRARRNAFAGRNSIRTWADVCPLCGKGCSAESGTPVYLTRDGSAILTNDEAIARPGAELSMAYVGSACMKRLGAEYRPTSDHPESDQVITRFDIASGKVDPSKWRLIVKV